MNRTLPLVAGIAATLALTALWHGPAGTADRFVERTEAAARAQLDHDEMPQVQAHLQRGPLTRRMILSGPADDFQRQEIARRMMALPGVGDATWDAASLPAEAR